MLTVSDIMSTTIVTVQMDDSLGLIKEIFDHTRFHHLLVVDNDQLKGVISDRDLLKSLSPTLDTVAETTSDRAALNRRAHQIMSRHPVVLNSCAPISDAVAVFNQQRFSCIPIVDSEGTPVGLLTWRDILKSLAVA